MSDHYILIRFFPCLIGRNAAIYFGFRRNAVWFADEPDSADLDFKTSVWETGHDNQAQTESRSSMKYTAAFFAGPLLDRFRPHPGPGKSAVALQFLAHGIAKGERCLLLSVRRAVDEVLWASARSLVMGKAIESGQFGVLEYGDTVPGRDQEAGSQPAAEGFLDLQRIVNPTPFNAWCSIRCCLGP